MDRTATKFQDNNIEITEEMQKNLDTLLDQFAEKRRKLAILTEQITNNPFSIEDLDQDNPVLQNFATKALQNPINPDQQKRILREQAALNEIIEKLNQFGTQM